MRLLIMADNAVSTTNLNTFEKVDESQLSQFTKLSNFETSAIFLKYAQKNLRGNRVINAGRGNPNWINTLSRKAFAKLIQLGIDESGNTFQRDDGVLAGFVDANGVADRLINKLSATDTVDQFIRSAIDYGVNKLGFDKDAFVAELLNGIIGNNYPVPSRSLEYSESVLKAYLQKNLFKDAKLADQTDVFPTEGGTAAMVYLFRELNQSHILNPGDTIAINSPIFTPYLQIPELQEYNLKVVELTATGDENWQMTDSQMDVLKDHHIKAFFDVNPTNPAARAYSSRTLAKFKDIVSENPNLVVVTDDVYGTFADDYQSIYASIPHNTILVYSFSKLYGATGCRLGLIAMDKDNVCDEMIDQKTAQNAKIKKELDDRYSMIVTAPEKMKFIDRTVADSRAIGLYHTAGLSTPQQIMMVLFAMSSLLSDDKPDDYLVAARKLVNYRYQSFWDELGMTADNSRGNTKYYTLVNVYDLIKKLHGTDFAEHFRSHYSYLSFPYRLATEFGAVVMDAAGFGTNEGYVRISLANLTAASCRDLARRMKTLVEEYYLEFRVKK